MHCIKSESIHSTYWKIMVYSERQASTILASKQWIHHNEKNLCNENSSQWKGGNSSHLWVAIIHATACQFFVVWKIFMHKNAIKKVGDQKKKFFCNFIAFIAFIAMILKFPSLHCNEWKVQWFSQYIPEPLSKNGTKNRMPMMMWVLYFYNYIRTIVFYLECEEPSRGKLFKS